MNSIPGQNEKSSNRLLGKQKETEEKTLFRASLKVELWWSIYHKSKCYCAVMCHPVTIKIISSSARVCKCKLLEWSSEKNRNLHKIKLPAKAFYWNPPVKTFIRTSFMADGSPTQNHLQFVVVQTVIVMTNSNFLFVMLSKQKAAQLKTESTAEAKKKRREVKTLLK